MLEIEYRNLLVRVMRIGDMRIDRTGVGTLSLFGEQLRGNISQSFPLFGGRKLFFKTVITELLWYIRGDSNLSFLHQHGCKIWDAWADENGDLGPVYGAQWRRAPRISSDGEIVGYKDQLAELIYDLRHNNTSRRMLINAWNPSQVDEMRLPPCAFMVQFYVRDNTYLDVRVDSRSADIMLGLPHNIAVYSLLTYILAHICGYVPGRYTHHLGDVHLYNNHITSAKLYLDKDIPNPPTLSILEPTDIGIGDFTHASFVLNGYTPGPTIAMPVAI